MGYSRLPSGVYVPNPVTSNDVLAQYAISMGSDGTRKVQDSGILTDASGNLHLPVGGTIPKMDYRKILDQTLHQICLKTLTTGDANAANYQGVATGGEIVELIYLPDHFIVTTAGTGGGTQEVPSGYNQPITAFPMGLNWTNANFDNTVINWSGITNWGAGRSWRYTPFYSAHQVGATPAMGWQMKLNSATAAARGRAGAGIQNLANWTGNAQCQSFPTIIAVGVPLSANINHLDIFYALARVLDADGNTDIVVGDYVVFVSAHCVNNANPQADTQPTTAAPGGESVGTDIYIVPGSLLA